MTTEELEREHIFSTDRRHRYTLWRQWHDMIEPAAGFVQFIGLNPSTADEVQDDPTVRKCIRFAARWKFTAMCMTNIFAYRATDPRVMKSAKDPVGQLNDRMLLATAKHADVVVACWGNHGAYLNRDLHVMKLLEPYASKVFALRVTQAQQPEHPCYLSYNHKLTEYKCRSEDT